MMNRVQRHRKLIGEIQVGDHFLHIGYMVADYKVIEIKKDHSHWGNQYLLQAIHDPEIYYNVNESDLLRNDGVSGDRRGMIPIKVLMGEEPMIHNRLSHLFKSSIGADDGIVCWCNDLKMHVSHA